MAKTKAQQLAEIQAAITDVLTKGQSFALNGRRYTRADLADLLREEKELEAAVAREDRGGIRNRRVVPIA